MTDEIMVVPMVAQKAVMSDEMKAEKMAGTMVVTMVE